MANQDMQYIQGPKMDWTEDTGLHPRFKEWREEVELLIDTVLLHIRNVDSNVTQQYLGGIWVMFGSPRVTYYTGYTFGFSVNISYLYLFKI